ncbi:MAG: zinc-finger domain-containing protein [Candidimonas sp.]|nr:MAG: zinc-finger domain-containing protein [Candidimonas sp.]
MSRTGTITTPRSDTIEIEADDLPLYCPGPKAPLWSMHPRVYIEIVKRGGTASCPYCSAIYHLKDGEKPPRHTH